MSLTKNKNAILYTRLSVEDGLDDMSCSIQNQIEILSHYAKHNEFRIIDIISDDGYTGTNFNRPGFKKMISMLENKEADTVIIKDLSRLGRNFLEVSRYTDEFFIENDIRFISITENYDSATSTDEMSLVIRNFLNGLYAKECRKKVMASVMHIAKTSRLSKNGIYGYKVVDNQFVIDEEVAPIIKRIFEEYISGRHTIDIARDLNDEAIPTPGVYRQTLSGKNFKNLSKDNLWKASTINNIINAREYTGAVVNLRRLKVNNRVTINPNPIIIENQHEAIIPLEQFNKAQAIIKRHSNCNKTDTSKVLVGLLFTEDNKRVGYCKKHYTDNILKGTYYNKEHNICVKVETLHDLLKQYCVEHLKKALKNKEEFKKEALEVLQPKGVSSKLNKLISEEKQLNIQYEELFEQYALGEIDEVTYQSSLYKINNLIIENKKQQTQIKSEANNIKKIEKNIDSFLNKISRKTLRLPDVQLIKLCIKKIIIIKIEKGKYKFKVDDIFQ